MGTFSRLGNDLYTGRKSIDFVGRRRLWYAISAVIILTAVSGLLFRGLNLGIEFVGGTEYTVALPANQVNQETADKLREAVAASGVEEAAAPDVNTNGSESILITVEQMSQDESNRVVEAIDRAVNPIEVSEDVVGASWGSQVASKALTGLIVFLVLVALFIWAYFREWKMSVGALVALGHDLVITVGVYALSGFQVTPATVTGVLTILGFSLYDTVVVFDKVRENTRQLRQSKYSYAQLANLAVNQTLVRSINTSIVALLPVAVLLAVGVLVLGSGDMNDLALSLFVGMAAGAYSSIFIATPLAVHLKESEQEISEQARRAKARQKRAADRYADVPAYTEELGYDRATLAGAPRELDGLDDEDYEIEEYDPTPERPAAPPRTPPRRPEASGSGRVVPTPKAPVRPSGSAKRAQPSRQPRSKRGK